jgi:hypothetical protein
MNSRYDKKLLNWFMLGKRLIKISVFTLALFVLTQGVAKKVPVIVFERTPCLGNCQSFKLSIFKNRKIFFDAGENTVVAKGKYYSKLKKKEYKQLIQLFRQSDFFRLENQHTTSSTDRPTQYLTFRDGDQSKTVMDYDHTNPTLIRLEDFLQQIVDGAEWRRKR